MSTAPVFTMLLPAEIEAKGAEIVDAESFNTGDVDFNSQLTSIKGTDAEAIYVPAYYQDITYITKQASDLGHGASVPWF